MNVIFVHGQYLVFECVDESAAALRIVSGTAPFYFRTLIPRRAVGETAQFDKRLPFLRRCVLRWKAIMNQTLMFNT